MPDYFTHRIAADEIFERCEKAVKDKITDMNLYRLGAQGGDLFFFYKLSFDDNLGRRLHTVNAREFFEELAKGNLSYAAGYATHYAMDCTLHPTVYAFEAADKTRFRHLRFENDVGLYISRSFGVTRRIMPRQALVGSTGAIYDSMKRIEPQITMTGVERCLKRYFLYTRYIYKHKRQTYRFDFDYSSLSDVIEEGISFGVTVVSSVIRGEFDGDVFSRSFLEKPLSPNTGL